MLTALEKRVIREQATQDSLFKEVSVVMVSATSSSHVPCAGWRGDE